MLKKQNLRLTCPVFVFQPPQPCHFSARPLTLTVLALLKRGTVLFTMSKQYLKQCSRKWIQKSHNGYFRARVFWRVEERGGQGQQRQTADWAGQNMGQPQPAEITQSSWPTHWQSTDVGTSHTRYIVSPQKAFPISGKHCLTAHQPSLATTRISFLQSKTKSLFWGVFWTGWPGEN